ncbi:MAG: DUF1320 domain-containing protein [Myxococcales bacterium]|uniref:DUF1320 domain-containing protein n=1 Tax=Sediminibacterium sp. TaxID=1917865 RepID=UPI001D27686A|nr:DUF1320 domain-containing protein [Sediminibacterium sp.]MBT9485834.1 DUF1320 domain-containing protein [Sediminibacterium sp.]MBT9556861.1 DUF1320 domain-containing protein [Myxococcales bacterium]
MSYCTRAHIEARLPSRTLLHFTDLDQDGVEDVGVVDSAIDEASAEVESYLAVRYPVPVSPVPRVLAGAATSVAIWNLARGRGYDAESADKAIRMAYDDAMKWLKALGGGTAQLPSANVGGTTAATAPTPGFKLVTRPPTLIGKLDRYG